MPLGSFFDKYAPQEARQLVSCYRLNFVTSEVHKLLTSQRSLNSSEQRYQFTS